MRYTISIDCGGTFTDGFLTSGNDTLGAKVLTTPYDLTVCFSELLYELARRVGVSIEELLSSSDIIRFSTTIGTNTILQRSGPKLGLVLSKGFKGFFLEKSPVCRLGFLREDMVEEVDELVGEDGSVEREPSEEEALQVVERLLDGGARYIVAGFFRAAKNPANEQKFKSLVHKNYPKHFLGSIPLLLSTEITSRPDEVTRINTALINAYLHRDMARFLYKADDFVRRHWHSRPLLVGHGSGGVARVAKTIALHTYNSGPAAGALGAASIAALYRIPKLVTADMGGTSLDATLIVGEKPRFLSTLDIDGIKCYGLVVEVNPIAAGGGSIATVADSRLEVGPRSAGSLPGPACFETGGIEPTVTDADLVLGYLNPERFLGGKIRLKVEAARMSIQDFIADALGISVEEAAVAIRNTIDRKIARFLRELIESKGFSPREFTLLAYGGAGATHCCSFAEMAGIPKVIITAQAPFFSAFGLANSRVSHFYEIDLRGRDWSPALVQARRKALRDMRGEGFGIDDLGFALWVISREGDVTAGIDSTQVPAPAELETVLLEASASVPVWEPVFRSGAGNDPGAALIARRAVYWLDKYIDTPVFERKLLEAGNRVRGPAIVEEDETTYVIPEGWLLTIDEFGNAVASRETAGGVGTV